MYVHVVKWKPIRSREQDIVNQLAKRPIMKSKVEYTYFYDAKEKSYVSIGYWSSKEDYDKEFPVIVDWFKSLVGIDFESFQEGEYIKSILDGEVLYKD